LSAERRAYWKNEQNLRDFFDDFAKEKGFDPTQEGNWYPVKFHELLKKKVCLNLLVFSPFPNKFPFLKGGNTIQRRAGGMKAALQRAYPELQFTQWLSQ